MVLINLQIAQEEQELREPPADVDRGQCNPPASFAYFSSYTSQFIYIEVTNIHGILFIAAISLFSAGFGLYHAWRLSRNSEKSAEKLDTSILPPGIFVLFAVLVFCALKPFFTSYALRYISVSFLFTLHVHSHFQYNTLMLAVFTQ